MVHRKYHLYLHSTLAIFTATFSFSSIAVANHTWQGPYVGAYFGGAAGHNHTTTNAGSITASSYFTAAADANTVNNAGSWNDDPRSEIIGIQAGHDWLWKETVIGVVADYGVMPLNKSTTATGVLPVSGDTYSVYTSVGTNWLLTLRGRVGYQTMLRWPSLFYITGGAAITQLRVNNNYSDNAALVGFGGTHATENQIGWTAGAGIEIATFGRGSLDLEYLYVRIPSVTVNSSIANSAAGFGIPVNSLSNNFSTTGSFHANIFRLGFNYRFEE